MTNEQLLAWAEDRVEYLHTVATLLWADLDYDWRENGNWNFILARDASCLSAMHERLLWCIHRAKTEGKWDCIWSEWHADYRVPARVRVGSRVLNRSEATSAACRA